MSQTSTHQDLTFPAPDFTDAARWAGAHRLSEVQSNDVLWLWPNRIACECVTFLVGDPGVGKSLLALDIAARLSRGKPWPDAERQGDKETGRQGEPPSEDRVSLSPPLPVSPSSVLLLTAEDGIRATVIPRLEALGADLAKIVVIPVRHQFRIPSLQLPDGDHKLSPMVRTFDLWQDLSHLNRLLHAMPDCRLIIVDPISAYVRDTNSDARSLLTQLTALALHHHIAVLVVSHLRKKEGAAIYRTMGSLAFVAASRAAWVVTRDPKHAERRLLMPLKNNLAPDVTGLAFTIESKASTSHPIIRWSPDPIAVSAETIIGDARPRGRPDAEREDAKEWLRKRLADGPRRARQIKEEADAHGINERTLRRAFRDLRGEAIDRASPPFSEWMWRLPGATCPSSQDAGQK